MISGIPRRSNRILRETAAIAGNAAKKIPVATVPGAEYFITILWKTVKNADTSLLGNLYTFWIQFPMFHVNGREEVLFLPERGNYITIVAHPSVMRANQSCWVYNFIRHGTVAAYGSIWSLR